MADITLNIDLLVAKIGAQFTRQVQQSITIAGTANASGGNQTIGTSAESVALADVGTVGWAFFRNADATNFVELGDYQGSTFYPVLRLAAGEAAVLRLSPSVTLYAKADTAAVILEKYIIEA